MRLALAALVLLVAACDIDIDEPWELAHDRIIAVRATPPRILPGETSTLDLLVGYEEAPVEERAPDFAAIVTPESLREAGLVRTEGGAWIVEAPNEEQLAAARTELDLEPGEPVPIQIGVGVRWPYPVPSLDGMTFGATKTVWVGDTGENPMLAGLMIDGAPPEGDELVVPKDTEVRLFVEADDKVHIVNWLTSCGEMHDYDLHSAYLVVTPESKQEGQLALVFRDDRGGVTWRVWQIRAE